MRSFSDATWPDIEALMARVAAAKPSSMCQAADGFCALMTDTFASVVLARLFIVLPFGRLPPTEQRFVTARLASSAKLSPTTPTLCLLGTRGLQAVWNDRLQSQGHLAIPLLDSESVRNSPMIARLLADLQIDLKALDTGMPIVTRKLLGGLNATFFVADAASAKDSQGRWVIPARDFAEQRGVRTVFGMGGSYVDGTLVVAICFCSELLERQVVDRFPSLISSFKMGTASLVSSGHVF
ncbi:MAG: hypothetical protein IPJ65_19555 [Archangiaceae bacterium]|nr:hypothetical protein [Archangiaceae bacterium]